MIADDNVQMPLIDVEGISSVVSVGYSWQGSSTVSGEHAFNSKVGTSGTIYNGSSINFNGTVPFGANYSTSSPTLYAGNFVCVSAYNTFTTPLNIPQGADYNFTVQGLKFNYVVRNSSGGTAEAGGWTLKTSDFMGSTVRITYGDGTTEILAGDYLTAGLNGILNFTISGESIQKSITQICFCVWYDMPSLMLKYGDTCTYSFYVQSSGYQVLCDYTESTNSILGNIIQWLKDIKDSIVNLPELIMEKIKGLFIPTEEDMTEIKDKFDLLMKERFGALYEAGSIISDFVEAFTYQGEKTSVSFPMVEIFLAGDLFVFGGWEVDLVPYGFTSIIGVLKGLIGIVCTLLFVVMLRNKFNKIVGDHT